MDIIGFGFILIFIISIIVVILMSCTCSVAVWLWLSLIITLNSLTIMSYFCRQEYKKTIEMRCYQANDVNGCGGQRATFFSFLSNVFLYIGIAYLILILFFCRKVILNIFKLFQRYISELLYSGEVPSCSKEQVN